VQVLKGALSFSMPNIDNNDGLTFVEDRDADETDAEFAQKLAFLAVPMARLVGGGLGDGTMADVTDFSQDLSISLMITHRPRKDFDELKHPQFFELVGAAAAAATAARLDEEKAAMQAQAAQQGAQRAAAAAAAASAPEPRATGGKRKLQAATIASDGMGASLHDAISLVDDDDAPAAKRARAHGAGAAAAGAPAGASSSSTGASLADAIEID
jgi:hypothetical protein